MPAETFADLDALAAKGDGSLRPFGPVWSYPGAPLPPAYAANLRIPAENIPDGRVRAALAAGAWVASVIDNAGSPARILAVVKAPADGASVSLRTPADYGRAA